MFVIDSEERRQYERAMRERAMGRVRQRLEKLRLRVEEGRVREQARIGTAAQPILQAHHGYRYYRWRLQKGRFHFEEDAQRLQQEKRLEGKYLIVQRAGAAGVVHFAPGQLQATGNHSHRSQRGLPTGASSAEGPRDRRDSAPHSPEGRGSDRVVMTNPEIGPYTIRSYEPPF